MAWQPRPGHLGWIKAGVFAACLVPLARLVYGASTESLGANPIEVITRSTGWWTLFLLSVTLAVTPLRKLSGATWLLRLRRMLGLFVFFYALAHFITFIWFDHWFDAGEIVKDVIKRPFVTVGFAAFLLLVPLAATSNNAMVMRLGRNWQRLHRLAYPIAVLGVLHFWWLVKRDLTEPVIFAVVVAALLGFRAFKAPLRKGA
jgi:sulfoxide reductase heme-binding subunit YedZ